MRKLIWTEQKKLPQRGTNWEIYFENVGKNGENVDSLYVVVVYVAFCRGGVFIAEPESYYIKEGKVNICYSSIHNSVEKIAACRLWNIKINHVRIWMAAITVKSVVFFSVAKAARPLVMLCKYFCVYIP